MGEHLTAQCPGCGAVVPASDGPTHRYIGAAPGCWALYGELLAEQYGPTSDPKTLRLLVDAYPAQHPGIPSRQAIRSVAFHLTRLCLVFVHGLAPATVPLRIGPVLDRNEPLSCFDPPRPLGVLTILDIHAAALPERTAATTAWARSVWDAWTPHHPAVHHWARRVLDSHGD